MLSVYVFRADGFALDNQFVHTPWGGASFPLPAFLGCLQFCVELRLCFLTHWEDNFPWAAAAACPYRHPASSPWRLQKNTSTELWPTSTARFSIPLTLVALFSMPSKFPFRMYCSHQFPVMGDSVPKNKNICCVSLKSSCVGNLIPRCVIWWKVGS